MTLAILLSAALMTTAATAFADVVAPDCSNYPDGEEDPAGRDRSVVLFHNACGTKLPARCRISENPGILADPDGLKGCKEGLGEIAAHVLEWEIHHACSGDRACAQTHRDLCLGKPNLLQLRRRLLRCSEKARVKLDRWSGEILSTKQ